MATSRIPIVFASAVGDPVERGLVQSFARPGGNITGVTETDIELGAKRLELFKEVLPGLRRVLFPYNRNEGHAAEAARVYRDAARQLGLVLVEKPVRSEKEVRATLSTLRMSEVEGIVAPSSISLNIPGLILDATSKRPIPTMFNGSFFVERGGLMSYGPDFYETGRQAARLMDKVLKGEDPGRIPVEANSRIELAINVKTAKALKLAIPPSVLQRATRLIE
jgi:putative ABC transport system substrate-binding protein